MNKPDSLILILSACVLTVLCAGCCILFPSHCRGTATISCGNLLSYQGDEGRLNTAQLPLGQVVVLNTNIHKAYGLGKVPYRSTDLETNSFGDKNYSYNAALNITFSANVPQSVKVQAESEIARQSKLFATNQNQVRMNDPAKLASAAQRVVDQVKKLQEQNPNLKVFMVFAESFADGISLKSVVTNNNKIVVNALKVGDFTLNVSYNCNEELNQIAKQQVPVFFKPYPLKLSSPNSFILDSDFDEDLSKYNLGAAAKSDPGAAIK